jgi:hypothetical protein
MPRPRTSVLVPRFWGGSPSLCGLCPSFLEAPTGEVVHRTGPEQHDGAYERYLSCDKRVREVRVLASESPEMLERLRERFLRALSELTSGGAMGEGKPAMVSEVAQGAGLDPERDPGRREYG